MPRKKAGQGVVTIRDIAKHLDIHPSSVSRALNPKTRGMITPELSRRVLKAAEELGYVPNSAASALKLGYSTTIGIIIPDLMNPVFPPIIKGAHDILSQSGYTLITAFSQNDTSKAKEEIIKLRGRNVDGFIIASAFRQDPSIDYCLDQDVPLVLVNRTVDRPGVNQVINDDALGIKLAVRHLVEQGHTRIALIAGPQNISGGYLRYKAYLEAIEEAGLEINENLVTFADQFTEAGGREAAHALLENSTPFTAVVASNDLIALGCIRTLGEKGYRCPEDISVVGFNDMPYLDWFSPPLTSVAIPHRELGEQAGKLLLDQLQNPSAPPRKLLLSPRLVVRGTTAPVSKS